MGTTTEIHPDSIVRRLKDVLFSQLDDEFLAIDAQAGYCYSLNETAGRVWDRIAVPISIQEICMSLREEYAVDEATCREDVVNLLKGLRDAGLVQVDQGAAG